MLTGSKFKDCFKTLKSFYVLRIYFTFRIIPSSPIVELFKNIKDVFKRYNGYKTKYQNNACLMSCELYMEPQEHPASRGAVQFSS